MVYQMVLNDADADDVTQEVFVCVIRGVEQFRGGSRFSTWLHRIVLNTVRSFFRRRRRGHEPAGEALRDPAADAGVAPDRRAMGNELDAAVSEAIGSLPEPLRTALVCTTLQGMGVREAARIAGCAPATIYWRVHKARKLLRQRLGDYLA